MAYDPEARKDSNTALIAGVAALILVIAAVAYFATRQPETVDNTVVITPSSAPATNTVTNTVVEQVPVVVDAPTAAPVVIEQTPRVIERNTTTVTNNTRTVVATPVPDKSSEGAPEGAGGRTSTNTNVTVNVPAPNQSPASSPTRAPAARDNGGVNVEGNAGNARNPAPAPRDSGY